MMDAKSFFELEVLKIPVPHKDSFDKKNTKSSKSLSRRGNDKSVTLDLHGQIVAEAREALKKKIGEVRMNKQASLSVITGKGIHSPGIYSPVKKAVEELLDEEVIRGNLEYKDKDGHFDIWLKY